MCQYREIAWHHYGSLIYMALLFYCQIKYNYKLTLFLISLLSLPVNFHETVRIAFLILADAGTFSVDDVGA